MEIAKAVPVPVAPVTPVRMLSKQNSEKGEERKKG